MYRPNAGTATDNIWITLGRLDWHFKGAATRDGATWTVDKGSASSATDPVGASSRILPVWAARYQALPNVADE